LCKQRFDGSNDYGNEFSIAHNIMQTAFLLVKTSRKKRFDGSKYNVNSVSVAMASNIMQTAFRWLKTLCKELFDGSRNMMKTSLRWLKQLFEQILC